MSTATRPTECPALPVPPRPSKALPRPLRVTIEGPVYDTLLELARRDFRKLEWQAAYLLTRAINDSARETADAR